MRTALCECVYVQRTANMGTFDKEITRKWKSFKNKSTGTVFQIARYSLPLGAILSKGRDEDCSGRKNLCLCKPSVLTFPSNLLQKNSLHWL